MMMSHYDDEIRRNLKARWLIWHEGQVHLQIGPVQFREQYQVILYNIGIYMQ